MGKVKIVDCQPCPFCGTPNDIELSRVDVQDREGFPVAMSCATCGCVGPWDYCPVSDEIYWLATAIHKWNQQSALNELSQLRAERDALKARVEECGSEVQIGVIEFHTKKNAELRDEFYEVVDDLRNAGSIVDVWLLDIGAVLRKHGYTMQVYRNNPTTPGGDE